MTWINSLTTGEYESQLSTLESYTGARPEVTQQQQQQTICSRNAPRSASLQTFGYHNTFHTHAPSGLADPPPTYERSCRVGSKRCRSGAVKMSTPSSSTCLLPRYDCTIEVEGTLSFKTELFTPFKRCHNERWQDTYATVRGTQFNIYRLKTPHILARNRAPGPGRLIKSYSLQHAEVGLALDFRKTDLVPRSALARLIPEGARQKVYETDPHLFEPVREHVLRLRVETEQILLCASTAAGMLTWIEKLCAAIDISQPIEDRSEPRYRSLPRRSRRQRNIEATALEHALNNGDGAMLTRIMAQQERLFQRLYPHLAQGSTEDANGIVEETEPATSPAQGETRDESESQNADPEAEDLDRSDVTAPSTDNDHNQNQELEQPRPSSSASNSNNSGSSPVTTSDALPPYDPKTHRPQTLTPAGILRFRRRCAPILLEDSPRASDVVFSKGLRWRIDWKRGELRAFKLAPPHYEVGDWTGAIAVGDSKEASKGAPVATDVGVNAEEENDDNAGRRPEMQRGISNMSDASIPRTVHEDATHDVEVSDADIALYQSFVHFNRADTHHSQDSAPAREQALQPSEDGDLDSHHHHHDTPTATPSLRSMTSHATFSDITTNQLSPSQSQDSIGPAGTVGEDDVVDSMPPSPKGRDKGKGREIVLAKGKPKTKMAEERGRMEFMPVLV